jgi:hypothetical protein
MVRNICWRICERGKCNLEDTKGDVRVTLQISAREVLDYVR